MKVVILCGGQGTRLREETEFRPKPMVEIGGKPILWHIMKLYAAHGFKDFVLALGYKGEQIKDYFLNYDLRNSDFAVELGSKRITTLAESHGEQDWRVTLADTGLTTMTGGRVARLRQYLGESPFMLTYGDGLADVDLRDLVRFHQERGRTATVTAVRPVARFGDLELDGDIARGFHEKSQARSGWINGGFFVLEPGIFDYLKGNDCVLETDPMERLAAAGQLAVYRHHRYWQCMDTLRDQQVLNETWAMGSAPWKVWGRDDRALRGRDG